MHVRGGGSSQKCKSFILVHHYLIKTNTIGKGVKNVAYLNMRILWMEPQLLTDHPKSWSYKVQNQH